MAYRSELGTDATPLSLRTVQGNASSMDTCVISCDPEVMGGTAVFSGTRVPVQILLDHLEAGETIDEFLEGFPGVTRAQVMAFLEQATQRLVAAVS